MYVIPGIGLSAFTTLQRWTLNIVKSRASVVDETVPTACITLGLQLVDRILLLIPLGKRDGIQGAGREPTDQMSLHQVTAPRTNP